MPRLQPHAMIPRRFVQTLALVPVCVVRWVVVVEAGGDGAGDLCAGLALGGAEGAGAIVVPCPGSVGAMRVRVGR